MSGMALFVTSGANKRVNDGRFASFCHFCSHFPDVEGHGEEGKVHCDLVLAEVAEALVPHVVFHLSEDGLWFYRTFGAVFKSFL